MLLLLVGCWLDASTPPHPPSSSSSSVSVVPEDVDESSELRLVDPIAFLRALAIFADSRRRLILPFRRLFLTAFLCSLVGFALISYRHRGVRGWAERSAGGGMAGRLPAREMMVIVGLVGPRASAERHRCVSTRNKIMERLHTSERPQQRE